LLRCRARREHRPTVALIRFRSCTPCRARTCSPTGGPGGGDTLGILLFTPLILSWSVAARCNGPRRALEGLLLAALLLAARTWRSARSGRTFVIVPLIVWRRSLRQREVTPQCRGVSRWRSGTLSDEIGPFRHRDANESLLLLLRSSARWCFTGLVLCAVLSELNRRCATAETPRELQSRVLERKRMLGERSALR